MTPNVFYHRTTGIGAAFGYVGQGVSTTNVAGRLLTDLITEQASELTTLPIVEHHSPRWEPLRWLGIRYVQHTLERLDSWAIRTNHPPLGGP